MNTIISVRLTCPVTKKTMVIPKADFDFNSWTAECDLCGSHGETNIDFYCKVCKTKGKNPKPVMHTVCLSSH